MSHRITPEQMLETCLVQMRAVLAKMHQSPLPTKGCDGCPLEWHPDQHGLEPGASECLHPDSAGTYDYAPEPGKCGLFIRPLLPPVVTP